MKMTTPRKCKTLSLGEKRKIIEEVEKGLKKKKDIAAEFGIPANTLSTIIKHKDVIFNATKESGVGPDRKRLKTSNFPGVENSMVKWLKYANGANLPISGQILREKAEQFAIQLGYIDFKASAGWLDKFKNRNGLVHKVSAEGTAVAEINCDKWKKEVLPQLIQDYERENIFNLGEAALFYKALPDKTMDSKNEKCRGKNSNDRVTVMLCANATGTEKLKLLVIGKSKRPRCFAGVKSLPVIYESNQKSRMTSSIFEDWLQLIDKKFLYEKRKILLFIDNSPAHAGVLTKELQAIKVAFLPADISAKLQTSDHSIIKNLKNHYRKRTVLKMLRRIDNGEIFDITLLDCVLELDKAWHDISSETISHSFEKVEILKGENEQGEWEVNEIPLSDHEWSNFKKHVKLEATFDEYANVDCDVIVDESPNDTDIIESKSNCINNSEQFEDNEEEDGNFDKLPSPPPTVQEAIMAVEIVKSYILSQENTSDDIFNSLRKIENFCIINQRNSPITENEPETTIKTEAYTKC